MTTTPTVTRRQALRATAGALALPTFLPPRVWAQGEEFRLGVIGVRNMGKSHLSAAAKNVVAVADVDSKILADGLKVVADKAGRAPAGYGDFRKILDDPDIHGVIIATPDHWHALMTVLACQAGKHVYCEKPLTLTVAEGRAMVRAARQHNVVVQTGSQQRSDAKFRLGCELVRSGRLGRLHTVRVGIPGVNFQGPPVADGPVPPELDYEMWLGPAPYRPYNEKQVHYNFRFFWPYSGGQMTNWGAHHLDIAQWGLGTDDTGPVEITGEASYHKDKWYEVPESFQVTYTYASGVKIICGRGQPGGTTFEGERGKIRVNRGLLESTPAEIVKEPLGEGDVRLYVSGNHRTDWLNCIRSGQRPICDVEIGHRSATVCHLGNIALRAGRTIRWDPVAERILDDDEANRLLHYDYRAPWRLPYLEA